LVVAVDVMVFAVASRRGIRALEQPEANISR
jgi:hypothetical protein